MQITVKPPNMGIMALKVDIKLNAHYIAATLVEGGCGNDYHFQNYDPNQAIGGSRHHTIAFQTNDEGSGFLAETEFLIRLI